MARHGILITLVVVVLAGGVGFIIYREVSLLVEVIRAGITREQFDAHPVGAPEAEVRAALPAPLSGIIDQDLYGNDPDKMGMPAGATCAYYTVRPFESGEPELWRFCFVDGVLTDKRSLTIP